MKEPARIRRDTVDALHDRLLSEFGGAAGVRDAVMLESALHRPKQRFHYEGGDLFQLAAAYAFGIARNHPFVDGNKRSAFATSAIFLQLNDIHLLASEADALLQTLALAAGELDESGYAVWLRENSTRA